MELQIGLADITAADQFQFDHRRLRFDGDAAIQHTRRAPVIRRRVGEARGEVGTEAVRAWSERGHGQTVQSVAMQGQALAIAEFVTQRRRIVDPDLDLVQQQRLVLVADIDGERACRRGRRGLLLHQIECCGLECRDALIRLRRGQHRQGQATSRDEATPVATAPASLPLSDLALVHVNWLPP